MTFEQENDLLFNHFLEHHFYDAFRKGERTLELIISPRCNTGCKYCYINKYRKKAFPACIYDNSDVIGNLKKILNWMAVNKFICPIEIFSGELFAQNIGYEVIETILDFYEKQPREIRPKHICVPTNFTFIHSDDCVYTIQHYIDRSWELEMPIALSASFDGKYMEQNRPYLVDLDIPLNQPRNDAYYDKVFAFCKRNNFGFHPMVYYENIDKWIRNFDWFQEKFIEYGIPWDNLYLLTVRNDGWTTEDNKHLYKFIQHIIDFAYNKVDGDLEKLHDFILKRGHGFNILSTPFTEHDRGIGCGLQTSLGIRVSDLTHSPCHRTMYPNFMIGKFVEDEEKILRYETKNAELGLTVYGFNTRMQPGCIKCPINRLCLGGCIGSQYETNKDLFAPIKSVCQSNWWLAKAIVDGLNRVGVLDIIKNEVMESKQKQIEFLQKFKVDI